MDIMNATTLIIVRHGQTEWNACERLQGQLDSPLTELGVHQAKAAAKQLQKMKIDMLYSSDLGRAVQTAAIIGDRLSMSFTTDANLRERHFGTMQGLKKTEFLKFTETGGGDHHSGNPDYVLPEGESIRQFYQRCIDGLEAIVSQHTGQTIVVVAHGGVLRNCLFKTLNLTLGIPHSLVFPNASTTVFSVAKEGTEMYRWELQNRGNEDYLEGIKTVSVTD